MSESPGGRNPNAFICHASEDKERFVRTFGTRLRAVGINAWVDEWEIADGDSLVEKVFAQGIANADAFLVVLSQFSINKPWVKAELEVGVIRRIEGLTRLIPVVLDDVTAPVALSAIKWQQIYDLDSYDENFEEIVRSIYGVDVRPPLGEPPGYVAWPKLPGLAQQDSVVLQELVRAAIDADFDSVLDEANVIGALSAAGIDEAGYNLSLKALKGAYLVTYGEGFNGYRTFPTLTDHAFRLAMPTVVPNLETIRSELIGLLVNEYRHGIDSRPLAERLGSPRRVVIVILRELEQRKLLLLSTWNPNGVTVGPVDELLGRDAH